METGTNNCVKCERDFSESNPCCCDEGTNEDGTHEEGYCRDCCPNPHSSWRSTVGTYERMDCDH